MTPSHGEVIKRTALPEPHLTVVILQRDDPNLLRPYLVFLHDDLSGEASVVGDFSCQATAQHAHDALVNKKERPFKTAQSFLEKIEPKSKRPEQ